MERSEPEKEVSQVFDDIERDAMRDEGLDPDDPSAVAAIDSCGGSCRCCARTPR